MALANSGLPDLPGDAQAISLLGDTLHPPPLPDSVRADRDQKLAVTQAGYDHAPDNADSIIWLGRRLAYLSRYRDAIATYSAGIETHPDDPRLYRHRGHRYITIRDLDRAIADLERAAELIEGTNDQIEPDGLPNAQNIPTSTLHSNIWYHLGLAYYLRGNLESALDAYWRGRDVSSNLDMLVATSHWLYMTLRRLGRDADAARVLLSIYPEMSIIENVSYHRLLLMYKGEIDPDSLLSPSDDDIQNATLAYGVANWHHYNGRVDDAAPIFRQILEGSQWAAFGYIAAEAEVARAATAERDR